MNVDLLWWFGAPIAGGGIITAGILVPRLKRRPDGLAPATKEGARVLPLRARAVAASHESVEAQIPGEAQAEPMAVPIASADEPTAIAPDAQMVEASAETVEPSTIARPAFGVRMARGLRTAFRRKRSDDGDAQAPHENAGQSDEHSEAVATPVLAAAATMVPFTPVVAEEEEAALEAAVALTPPLVSTEPEAAHGPAENGIVDIDVPPGEDPATWRAGVAAREAQLRETSLDAQRLREETVADEQRRSAEVAAHERQIDLENIALAEEVRVRTEARLRKWYARLDLEVEAPTVEVRMAMASSLVVVRALWAGKLLREAFFQEDEARVRARLIGALVSGDHLDVTNPFYAAFENGGIERAATFEMLMPRQHEAQWIIDLLAPLLVA